MREIKFRAWDNERGRYFEDINEAYLGNIEQLYIGLNGSMFTRSFDSFNHESTFPGRFILEQYTGLKDKKGREIYEGDIVWRPRGHSREVVEFDYGFYPFDTYELGEMGMPGPDECKVIGNIHENPDLLSEAKVK